ncbi:MAG: 23S rRNA (uracil(1939)-C(5))-methyltransferase RlmD [Lachnospiraceae bacterium]|nr:23S rRNA (uracil(1939)-C(5))-methyltransferase RlmD [Lachnospiraceae bacterium]
MKKGTVCQGTVERIQFPNKGIVRVEDTVLTVKNALPGQRVQVCVTKNRSGRGEARLQEVLEPSPLETAEHPCRHAGLCGGCLYQTIPYEEQLKIKEGQVRELLRPVLGEEIPMSPILASPCPEEYRNKMEFSFGDAEKDGPMTLGMHRRGSFYDVVTVDGCRIVDEDFRQILRAVLEYMQEKQVPFYKKMARTGFLRHLLVRKAARTGEILVDLVTTPGYAPEADFTERLLGLPLKGTLVGILHTVNSAIADVVRSDETFLLYGRDYLTENLLGLTFRITPFSFFQTNSLGAEVLYDVARRYIGDTRGKKIYDLYSGTGTIAQILAPVAEHVTGVEIVEEAVDAARANARLNGLTNCDFIAGDVLKVLDSLPEAPDLLVLDPPRDGVHPKALRKILNYQAERIVYISCKPTSLARDLVYILEAGYQVEAVQCVDMFPATANVETVVQLSQQKPDDVIRVGLDLDELDITAADK